MAKQRTSFALSEEAKRLLLELSQRLGVSQASVVEMAVREFARSQNVEAKGVVVREGTRGEHKAE